MTEIGTKNGCAENKDGSASPPPATSDKDAGRGANGRFAAGNKLGRGNPFARQVAELRRRIVNAVTKEDLDEIVRGLIDMAKHRDLAAIKLLLSYVIGKPADIVNPDTLDLEEWQVRAQSPSNGEAFDVMQNRLPFNLLTALANSMNMAHVQMTSEMLQAGKSRMAAAKEAKAPPADAAGASDAARYSPHSIAAGRLTAALGKPPAKAKKHEKRSASIFQRLRRQAAPLPRPEDKDQPRGS